MKRLIIANWKMNFAPGEASIFLRHLTEKVPVSSGVEVVLCPPFLDLHPMAQEIKTHQFKLGAQNLSQFDNGPYTGEISGNMLRGLVDYVIVGHSERRAMGETDKQIAAKIAAAIRNNLTPILCIGETVHDREHGLSEKVVVDQLTAALANVTAKEVAGLVIAYEPVWAIDHHDGHHVVPATPEQIRFAYRAIRTTLEELYGEAGTHQVRLLYGGSVNAEHTRAYLESEHVDGLLVGTASLNADDFSKIVDTAADVSKP